MAEYVPLVFYSSLIRCLTKELRYHLEVAVDGACESSPGTNRETTHTFSICFAS